MNCGNCFSGAVHDAQLTSNDIQSCEVANPRHGQITTTIILIINLLDTECANYIFRVHELVKMYISASPVKIQERVTIPPREAGWVCSITMGCGI